MIEFRRIKSGDEIELLQLRNNSLNLRYFRDSNKISEKDHASWFASRISEFSELQIVGISSSKLIGIAFLTPINLQSASISINIHPEFQSQGVGRELLTRILSVANSHGITRIEALIHVRNSKSIALFEASGFTFEVEIAPLFSRYVKVAI